MKAVVLLALVFILAAVFGVATQYGTGVAFWATCIGAGIAVFMIVGHFISSSPPALPGTRRVQIARAIYEGRPIEDVSRLPASGNHGQQPSVYIPSMPKLVAAPHAPQVQLRLEHNTWPQIPLQQNGQHQLPGGKVLTYEEIARLIEQMNRAK